MQMRKLNLVQDQIPAIVNWTESYSNLHSKTETKFAKKFKRK